MRKETVLKALNDFPKEFNLDDLFERLVVIQRIDEGLEDERKGRVVTHEDVKKEIKKWRK